ncbi:MAG: hypothetical protein K9L88_08030 [Chromatiaceae bacterium]|nr:hypothetical protein [Chromatiaceae bacterium]
MKNTLSLDSLALTRIGDDAIFKLKKLTFMQPDSEQLVYLMNVSMAEARIPEGQRELALIEFAAYLSRSMPG